MLCHAIPCYSILLCCILYLLFLISLVYVSNVSMCPILLKKVCFYLISIHPQSDAVTFLQTHCLCTVKWVAMWYVWCYIYWYDLTMRLLISWLDRTFWKLTPVSSFFAFELSRGYSISSFLDNVCQPMTKIYNLQCNMIISEWEKLLLTPL